MGYSITIGELLIETRPEDAMECSGLWFSAKGERHDNAPAFGEPTDFTNERWPSYSAWHNFTKHCGLYDLFFCEGHLIGGHPGVRLLTTEILEAIEASRTGLESTTPAPVASLDLDSNYCRLLWLEYWVRWALQNCKTPVIANS